VVGLHGRDTLDDRWRQKALECSAPPQLDEGRAAVLAALSGIIGQEKRPVAVTNSKPSR